jgi:hypothetical protein
MLPFGGSRSAPLLGGCGFGRVRVGRLPVAAADRPQQSGYLVLLLRRQWWEIVNDAAHAFGVFVFDGGRVL